MRGDKPLTYLYPARGKYDEPEYHEPSEGVFETVQVAVFRKGGRYYVAHRERPGTDFIIFGTDETMSEGQLQEVDVVEILKDFGD